MDDSSLPKRFAPINKRLTQSLSPLSFNNFMTQKKKNQKKTSHELNQNENLNQRGTFLNSIFELNKTSLSTAFSHHAIAFRLIQELLLFHRPIPFVILISLLNLSLYFYRSFHLTFYSHAVLLIFIYILILILYSKVWPIVYETLFLNNYEIQRMKEINFMPGEEDGKEQQTNDISKSSEDISESSKTIEIKMTDEHEVDPRYDPKSLNRLRTPEEAANIVFKYINPIRIFMKAFVILANDNSLEGLEIMFFIYLFFLCFTLLFDLFWPIVIFLNVILVTPGIYFNPQIRRLIRSFRKKWKV